MTLEQLQAIVVAAGKSSRLATGRTKLVEKLCGQELIAYPLQLLSSMGIPTAVVLGYDRQAVEQVIKEQANPNIPTTIQEEQCGTAGAVFTTRNLWHQDTVLVMHADLPLLSPATIEQAYKIHCEQRAVITFVAAHNADPALTGYARVIQNGKTITITEQDANAHESCCVNAGIYLIERSFLELHLADVVSKQARECSFGFLVNRAAELGLTVAMHTAPFDEIRSINTLQDLWAAEHIKRSELIKYWMERGVRFSSIHGVHIDLRVTIGSGSYIGCGVHLLGNTQIGTECTIHEFSSVDNSSVADGSSVYAHSLIKDSSVGANSQIGPFAHIREQSAIGNNCIIGNFVELKKTRLDDGTRAKHLTYLGDSRVGSNVNIGAGTITANHNGVTKNVTIIEDGAYIGANNTLIAPVTIEANAMTAAGSTITDNVPADALAIARSRQVNKDGYAQKMRERATKKPEGTISFVGARKIETDSSSMNE